MPSAKPPVTKECLVCGTSFGVQPYRAASALYCCAHCRQTGIARSTAVKRADSLRNRGGNKTYKKWFGKHLHRVVAEQILGRQLNRHEVVHHRDGNKLNNDPSNLEITTQPDHINAHRAHMMQRRKIAAGY